MGGAYRADIDGLRGIAILLVVGFHLGLPGLGFGFVGVDIFFVISGFLITGLLVAELELTGRIDLLGFYARRVRRLIPALAVMLLATLVLGAVLLPPDGERQSLGAASAAAAGFVANLNGLLAQSGYFSATAYTLPLLHLWTLSVEEQFYLVWPLGLMTVGLWATTRGVRRPALALVIFASLVSFGLAAWLTRQRPEAGFFLPFSRAWEFGAGAVLALGEPTARRIRRADWLGWSGAILLTASLVSGAATTVSTTRAYSAFDLIAPVLGAAMLIAAGTGSSQSPVSGALRWTPLAWVGRVSYGWYLWHWPLLCLARLSGGGRSDLGRDIAIALLALGLAAGSFYLIEQPARQRRWPLLAGRRPALVAGAMILATCAMGGGALWTWANWSLAHDAGAAADRWRLTAAAKPPALPLPAACDDYWSRVTPPAAACIGGATGATRLVLLWGDSHARQYGAPLIAAGKRDGFGVLERVHSGCHIGGGSRFCDRFSATVLNEIPVLIHQRGLAGVAIAGDWPVDGAWRPALQAVVDQLTAWGLNVLLIEDSVHLPVDPRVCYARRGETGCGLSRATADRQRAPISAALAAIAAGRPRVRIMDALGVVCANGVCPVAGPEGLLYYDFDHFSAAAAPRYLDPLATQAPWLLGKTPAT